MKLIAQLTLLPMPRQADALLRTLEGANAACEAISRTAWETSTFQQFALHRLSYGATRGAFGLSAQVSMRCINKVVDAYRCNRTVRRTFKLHGSIAYDDVILSWNPYASSVSIWSVDGRQIIPFVAGTHQHDLLHTRRGETDLAYVRGKFYLLATFEVEEFAGIDPTTSATGIDGYRASSNAGAHTERGAGRGSAPNGNGASPDIRTTCSPNSWHRWPYAEASPHVGGSDAYSRSDEGAPSLRPVLRSSASGQLRAFMVYEAQRAGVPVVLVDPRNTSQDCWQCGHIDEALRLSRANLRCTSCSFAANADVNVA